MLGQIAVPFVRDNHRRPCLGDQKVGPGDPDVGHQIARPQDLARFRDQIGTFG